MQFFHVIGSFFLLLNTHKMKRGVFQPKLTYWFFFSMEKMHWRKKVTKKTFFASIYANFSFGDFADCERWKSSINFCFVCSKKEIVIRNDLLAKKMHFATVWKNVNFTQIKKNSWKQMSKNSEQNNLHRIRIISSFHEIF